MVETEDLQVEDNDAADDEAFVSYEIAAYPADYTLSGIVSSVKPGVMPYVLIPAHQSSALVTLTPIDDTRVEGNESAIFSIV